ncbi:hypothetical protein ACI7RC_27595 [Brevibacillus sp. B_LB10_24]|uniref:hypothetical protein n=1 Tax=Brevibacillus sp. B_LB10_24 TaxID=3380645 RepID=UPI0038B7FD56
MNKKFLLVIIIVSVITSSILLWLSNKERSLDYDDYKEMELLSQKSRTELEKKGYSDLDIRKIEEFNANYKNHLTLVDIVENDNLENYGYNNRSLNSEVKSDIVYDENYFDIQDSNLSYTTTVMDLVRDKNADRDAGRIVIEFEWDSKPATQKQYINVKYPKYILENIYTYLKYENPNDKNDVVYKMCEIEPYNFIDEFQTNIDPGKTINQQNYILKSGIIVLDIKSYYMDSIAPFSISSQYVAKPLLGKEKILSVYKIMNAKIKMPK